MTPALDPSSAEHRPTGDPTDAASAPDSAAPGAFDLPLQPLGWRDPFRWLALGWRDFRRCPGIGLFYGTAFAVMGGLLMKVFAAAPAYTLALSAGFLLMGPFLCMGLYDASARLERGERPDLGRSLLIWTERLGALAIFCVVLLVLEMLWARASLVIFAVSFDRVPDFHGSLLRLVSLENAGFIAVYLAVGGVFAALIYGVSVVSIPMILDRGTDAIGSGLMSLRLVLAQPGVMLLWAALLALAVFAAMLPAFLGLLVVAPVLGHASWHAYRAAVGPAPSAVPVGADAPG
ncbi:DUF2189 domain-containing protein [Piscinibacter sakaiensis]|uniref:DUF2189 domain-containing protein n=1 Tax=Piscinibacter sakaiensis TaxID=1547922 RepID=UPI00372CA5DF